MRSRAVFAVQSRPSLRRALAQSATKAPIIHVQNGTFYRHYPLSKDFENYFNPPIFPNLYFSIQSGSVEPEHWAVLGPSSSGKTTFLEILRGQHLCIPPTARSFPYLSSIKTQMSDVPSRNPTRAIQYVGFTDETGGPRRSGSHGAYLSARYESRREESDYSVSDYLKGNIELNPSESIVGRGIDEGSLRRVVEDLRLGALVNMPLGNLSNGQIRRARIAKALLSKPEVLLLDEPFMGLDPPTLTTLSPLLHRLAQTQSPRLVLALRPQDLLPDWITHIIFLGPGLQIVSKGYKEAVLDEVKALGSFAPNSDPLSLRMAAKDSIPSSKPERDLQMPIRRSHSNYIGFSREGLPLIDELAPASKVTRDPLVQMEAINIKYGGKQVLGGWKEDANGEIRSGLWWTVRRGERWGIFGPNGSGKTTLLSLICSDHPQSYSLRIKIFGHSRLPTPGIPGVSVFDIQARIGQSSPEIHRFFPRNLTIRQTIRNAWADTFLGTPHASSENDRHVDSCLRWFEPELNPGCRGSNLQFLQDPQNGPPSTSWADEFRFGDVTFSSQRVALLVRAMVKKPDLLILDEAFSGMDGNVRDKCMLFLTWGETRSFRYTSRHGVKMKREIITTPSGNARYALIHGMAEDQALICVSHVEEEVPGLVRDWLRLPEASKGNAVRFGRLQGPLEGSENAWADIWDLKTT